jgi:hypothetical protein
LIKDDEVTEDEEDYRDSTNARMAPQYIVGFRNLIPLFLYLGT